MNRYRHTSPDVPAVGAIGTSTLERDGIESQRPRGGGRDGDGLERRIRG